MSPPPRLIKYKERWFVDRMPTRNGDFKLKQTGSNMTIAMFSLFDEAQWVSDKLNYGRELCEAAKNMLNVDDWLNREPSALVDELRMAVRNYMRDNV